MPYIRSEEWRAIRRRLALYRRLEANPSLRDDSEFFGELPQDVYGLRKAIASDVLRVKAGAVEDALVEQVCQLRAKQLRQVHGSREPVLTDRVYDVISVGVFERVLASRRAPYQHEISRGESGDFARLFSLECVWLGVNSVGRVLSYSGGHVFNVAVCREDDGERLVILMVEPATRKVVTGFTGKYCLRDILAIVS